MKIVSSSIQIVTLILISCTFLFAGQHEQLWEYKNWQVDTHNGFVRCVTHGQVVHGHEFAIVKRKGNNNQNLLYISWSTSNKGLTKYKGKDAVLRLQIDDIRRQVTIPLLSVKEHYPGLTVGTFTNIAVGEEFISLLQKGHKLEVTIHGPEAMVGFLDITSDTFSLDGFTATLLKAQEFCEPTDQREITDSHAQQTQNPETQPIDQPIMYSDTNQIIQGIIQEGYDVDSVHKDYFNVAFESAMTAILVDCMQNKKCKIKEAIQIESLRRMTFQKLKDSIGRPEMRKGSPAQVIGVATYEIVRKNATIR